MLLEQIAFGRRAQCEARRGWSGRVISYDRVLAVCRVNGRSTGDLLRGRDYANTRATMIFGVAPAFDEILASAAQIAQAINRSD